MHIANPIYDVIFKYLLEDNKSAKLLLSAIIGESIEELDFGAQEHTVEIRKAVKEKPPLTVCRFDFSAKVKTETGFKTIGIELQKAKLESDLMRFRRYLGVHYQTPGNTYLVPAGKKSVKKQSYREKPREIYCIYFLAYGMDLPGRPVLKVNDKVEDAYNGEEFSAAGDFISGLHHRSWIVQINELKKHRRNMLEKILSVFDQSAVVDHRHIIEVDDESFPAAYREIIRRLRKAMEDPEKRREMELEDDIINELREMERRVEAAKKEVAAAKRKITQANKTIDRQDKTIATLQSDNDARAKRIAELENILALQQAPE